MLSPIGRKALFHSVSTSHGQASLAFTKPLNPNLIHYVRGLGMSYVCHPGNSTCRVNVQPFLGCLHRWQALRKLGADFHCPSDPSAQDRASRNGRGVLHLQCAKLRLRAKKSPCGRSKGSKGVQRRWNKPGHSLHTPDAEIL